MANWWQGVTWMYSSMQSEQGTDAARALIPTLAPPNQSFNMDPDRLGFASASRAS
jgi:hypothetical protein